MMIVTQSFLFHAAAFSFQIIANNGFVLSEVVRAKHVVGAGLGRTGTESFKYSIAQLGLGPGFHMQDNLEHLEHVSLWEKLEELSPLEQHNINADGLNSNEPIWESKTLMEPNKERVQIFSEILGINTKFNNATYPSSMDFPTCMFFRDIIEAYKQIVKDPREVKVVFTSRTSGEKWASSFLGTIGMTHPSLKPYGMRSLGIFFPPFWTINRMMQSGFNRFFPSNIGQYSRGKQVQRLSQYHDSWKTHVRQVMDAYANENGIDIDEVFLDYQVQHGWEPLCKFLFGSVDNDQSPCPKEGTPYPNRNNFKSMATTFFYYNMFGYAYSMVLFILMYFISKLLWKKIIHFTTGNNKLKQS